MSELQYLLNQIPCPQTTRALKALMDLAKVGY